MADLITYLGNPELKAALLVEIAKHETADQIVKGTYGQMKAVWHGCAIGCSLRSLNLIQRRVDVNAETGAHARFPTELGWPLWLAYAEDNIFEQLPDDLAHTWPRRLAEAVPVGVTIPDAVLANVLRWILIGDGLGVVRATTDATVKAVVRNMGTLFDRVGRGEVVTDAEFDLAAWDAWDAWDARDARVAWAARVARDARVERDAFYPALSEELIRLLKACA